MKRFFVCLLALCMLLSGCSLFDSSKYAVTPHLNQSVETQKEVISVQNYSQLRSELVKLVHEGVESSVINVPDYNSEQLVRDLGTAIAYVRNQDAIGAYAVEDISYEVGTNGFVAAVALKIAYVHGREELLRIQNVRDMEEALKKVGAALQRCEAGIVMLVDQYEEMDLIQMVEDYTAANPDTVMELPTVTLEIYPGKGIRRVVNMKFTYQNSRNDLRQMQTLVSQIFDAAGLYVTGSGSDHQKLSQLYAFLMERFTEYQIKTSITPSYSLLLHGVGDSRAVATVYGKMCSLSGLECQTVTGTRNGEPWSWNIVRDGELYYHVDLLRCSEKGAFKMRTDAQMEEYVWDYSAYPVCNEKTAAENADLGTKMEKTEPFIGE